MTIFQQTFNEKKKKINTFKGKKGHASGKRIKTTTKKITANPLQTILHSLF